MRTDEGYIDRPEVRRRQPESRHLTTWELALSWGDFVWRGSLACHAVLDVHGGAPFLVFGIGE